MRGCEGRVVTTKSSVRAEVRRRVEVLWSRRQSRDTEEVGIREELAGVVQTYSIFELGNNTSAELIYNSEEIKQGS